MLRNLLYSFFLHIMFISLIFISTAEIETKTIKFSVTPITINFVSENEIENLQQIEIDNQDERVKNLSLDEKINLYNKLKNNRELEEKRAKLFEKSKKKPIPKNKSKFNNKILEEDNEFSYYYTPVYVLESKIDTEQKRKLIESRLKKEELRKKMKENKINPVGAVVNNTNEIKTVQELIDIAQKPLKVKQENPKDINIVNDMNKYIQPASTKLNISKDNTIVEQSKQQDQEIDTDEIVAEISLGKNKIDEKYKDLKEGQVFSKEDYKKLKEIEDSKSDVKYLLSLREKRNIQRQIKGCYKMAILKSKKDSKAIVSITVNVDKDGIIDSRNIKVDKLLENSNKDNFNIALENAKSALVFCSPLRGLPSGKYKSWKQMTFVFDSNNLE